MNRSTNAFGQGARDAVSTSSIPSAFAVSLRHPFDPQERRYASDDSVCRPAPRIGSTHGAHITEDADRLID